MHAPLGFHKTLKATAVSLGALFLLLLCWAALAGPTEPTLYVAPLLLPALLWAFMYGRALFSGRHWAWIAYIALFVFITQVNLRNRSMDAQGVDWQVAMKLAAWFGAGAVGLIRVRRIGSLWRSPVILLALALVSVMLVSSVWSVAPTVSALSAFLYLCVLIFTMAVVTLLDEREILIGLLIGMGAIVLPSLAISPFTPSFAPLTAETIGDPNRLRGFATHPVSLATISSLMMLVCGVLVVRIPRLRLLWILLGVLAFVTILLSQSRMAMVAFLGGVSLYWLRSRPGQAWIVPVFTLTVAMTLMTVAAVGIQNLIPKDLVPVLSRSGDVDELLTLTGRLTIWDFAIQKISEAPILGFGHATTEDIMLAGFDRFPITHPHNLLLQSMLSIGLVGTMAMLAILLIQLRAFFAAPSLLRDILFLALLLVGVTEVSFLTRLPTLFLLCWMLSVSLTAKQFLPARAPSSAGKAHAPVPGSRLAFHQRTAHVPGRPHAS